jgi:rhodanese-related sulfurtransferase
MLTAVASLARIRRANAYRRIASFADRTAAGHNFYFAQLQQEATMAGGERFKRLADEAKSHIREVDVATAAAEQSRGALLIDVRESEDFAKQHARGAIHISRGMLELKIEGIAPDPATPILCYCGGGSRSALDAESLGRMGYTNAASVIGGFKAWKEAGQATEST